MFLVSFGLPHLTPWCCWIPLPPSINESLLAIPELIPASSDLQQNFLMLCWLLNLDQDCNRVLVSLISWPGQLLSLNPCGRPKILARMPFFGIYALFCRTFGDLRTLLSMPVFSPHMKAQLDLLSLSMWINACQGHEQMVYSLFFVQGN